MVVFLLFPSMGVWAMRTKLCYYLQPLYQPWTEVEPVQQQQTHSGEVRAITYQGAQRLREKLQNTINQLISRKLDNL
jgi:hypothetical protein